MTTRTFKQLGQAFGPDPVTITAKIDGVIVFDQTVAALDEPFPSFPDSNTLFNNELFTWTEDVAFAGQRNLEVTVSGGTLLLTDTLANFAPSSLVTDPPSVIVSDDTHFYSFYVFEENGTNVMDPFTDIEIDGAPKSTSHTVAPGQIGWHAPMPGQWYWRVPSGSVFTAVVNIQAGTAP